MSERSVSHSGSVSSWIRGVKAGDESALARLWERYHKDLIALARRKLGSASRRVEDEEDVAASVLKDFYKGATNGRYEDLHHRDQLWRLLLCITQHKAIDHGRHYGRAKRSPNLDQLFEPSSDLHVDELESREPPPELLTLVSDQIDNLLGDLRDDVLKQIALLHLEGGTTESISEQLKIARRSVQRKIKLIKNKWAKELDS